MLFPPRLFALVYATDILSSRTVNAQNTSADPPSDLQLEIAHLLLIDVVGYSRLLVNEQIELLHGVVDGRGDRIEIAVRE